MPALFGLEGFGDLTRRGVSDDGRKRLDHLIRGDPAKRAAIEPRAGVFGVFKGESGKILTGARLLQHGLRLLLGFQKDMPDANLIIELLEADLLFIHAVNRRFIHLRGDEVLHQEVAQQALTRGLQPALGGRCPVKAAADRFLCQKALVDQLVEDELVFLMVWAEGVTGLDTPLRNGFQLDIREVNRVAIDQRGSRGVKADRTAHFAGTFGLIAGGKDKCRGKRERYE